MIPTSFLLQSHSVRYLHNYTFIDYITVGSHYIKKNIFEYETINKTHKKLNKKLTMHVSLLSSIAHLHWIISHGETQMRHIAYRIRWFIFIYQQYPHLISFIFSTYELPLLSNKPNHAQATIKKKDKKNNYKIPQIKQSMDMLKLTKQKHTNNKKTKCYKYHKSLCIILLAMWSPSLKEKK